MTTKKLNKIHTRQLDQSDCGVAALLSIIKYFEGQSTLERLRELSGTSRQGTTLLGLVQAAQKIGISAEGFQADLENLKTCEEVTILHILKENRFQHYVVCFGFDEKQKAFAISDPSENEIKFWSVEDLEVVWQSKTLLILKKTPQFQHQKSIKNNQWIWLKSLVQEDLNILGTALFLGIIIAVLGLATAIFSQTLIDDILPSADSLRLFIGVGILMVLLIGKGVFGYLRQLLLLRQSKDFNIRIIDQFLGALLHLPKPFFDNRKTGDLIARMNDTQRIQRTVSNLISSVMIDVLMVLVATIAIFSYDWQIGLVAMIWIPIFTWVVFFYHPKIVQAQRNMMKAYAQNESNYVDTIQGIGIIKATNKQNVFSKLTKTIYTFLQQSIFDLGKVGIGFGLVTEIIGALFIVGVIAWSSINVLAGILTVGSLIAMLQLVGILMVSASRIAVTNIQLQEAKVAFERMTEFTSITSEYDEEIEKPKAKITNFMEMKIENLSFRFPGRPALLRDISLEVKKGEWIAILGESGCGKSTLMQIMQKFYAWENGKIKVNGIDLEMVAFESWRNCLGVVSQETKIFNTNLIQNILLGREVKDLKELEHFFKFYGFDQFFQKFPNGYSTILGEDGVNISGGQKQLVALARALFHQPQLLLLDEPTAALDRKKEKFVLNLLEKLKENTAIISFTHKLKTAKRADRIYLIENGVINQFGKHEQLLNSPNFYSEAWKELNAT